MSVWCGCTAVVFTLIPKDSAQRDPTSLVVAMLISIVASVLILSAATYAAGRTEARSKVCAFVKQLIASEAIASPLEAVVLVALFTVTFASLVWAVLS
jgi:hypothetical protein